MDVTPPSALRRIGIAFAGLAVAGLTAAACALSFDDLRALAVLGRARADLAFLYPAAFDALLAVALISVLLLRAGRFLVRAQAAVVLVLLIAAAATVNVLVTTNGAARLPADAVAVGVAVAPWVMLGVALWLWLVMIKQVQARREQADAVEGTAERDIVPFRGPREAPPLTDAAAEPEPEEPTPVVGPTPAPETPPVPATPARETTPALETPSIPVSERVTRWHSEPGRTAEPQAVPKPRTDPDPELDLYPGPAVETRSPEPVPQDPAPAEQDRQVHASAETQPVDPEPAHPETAPPATTQAQPVDPEPAYLMTAQARPVDPDPAHAEPVDLDLTSPDPAHSGPAHSEPLAAEEPPSTAGARDQEADVVTAPHPVHTGEPAEPVEEPQRPVRWGDLPRTRPADVLVHPRPGDSDSVKDADTQPVRVVSDSSARPRKARPATARPVTARAEGPDPGHGPEAADETEPALGPDEPHEPQEAAPADASSEHEAPHHDAPSGRLRSTPLPPEE
ncbi:hypothetical protein [Nonomuraea sp. bgisy101]|uniref:hypothetical protein n=1 Tax=Nonomuraea sp. bgisy101 TaxID=3413784 RepID=UPI003D71B7F6